MTTVGQRIASEFKAGTARDTTSQEKWMGLEADLERYNQYEQDQIMGTGQEVPTYASAPGIEDMKNWDQLTKGEQTAYAYLPKIPAWIDSKIPEALKVAWGPIGEFIAPVLQGAGKVLSWLDLGAEATERLYGFGKQIEYGLATGTMKEFMDNIPAAWKAGTFAANVMNPMYLNPVNSKDPAAWKPPEGELPGVYGLVRARQLFAEGKTTAEVEEILSADAGALWIRGQFQDLAWHMILDPLNLVAGGVSKVAKFGERIRGLRRGEGMVAQMTAHVMDVLGPAAGKAQDLRIAAERATETIRGAEFLREEQAVSRALTVAEVGKAVDEKRLLDAGVTSRELRALEAAGMVQRLPDKGATRMYNVDKLFARNAELMGVRKAAEGLPEATAAFQKASKDLADANKVIELVSQERLGTFGRKFLWLFGGEPLTDMTKPTFALFAPGYSLVKPWTWFRMTPQAKASEMLTTMADSLGFLIKDMSVEDAHKMLSNINDALLNPKLGTILYTPEGRGIVLALQGFKTHADDLLAQWVGSQKERELLERISAVLGKVDDEIVTALKKGNADSILAELAKADKKTTAGAAILAGLEDGSINKAALEQIGRLFFDGQVAYNKNLFKLHMIGAAADFTKAQMALQFGEQYAGLFEKAAGALKAAETLAYLRLNPTYPIRNFLNNELTMWARGVWGTMSEKQIAAYWSKMGIDPARLGQGMGPAELKYALIQNSAGKSAKAARFSIENAVRDAEEAMVAARYGEGKSIFDTVRRGINNINIGKADMGAWAAQIEANASRRAYTTAFIEGMNEYWKPSQYMSLDEYVKKYHPGLDISALPEGIRSKVEAAMRSARYVADIPEAVLGRMQVAVDDVLNDAALGAGFTRRELEEVMGPELMHAFTSELAEPLAKGDMHGVNRVLENTRIAIQNQLDDWADKDAQAIIDNVAARVAATNDPTAFIRVYSESMDMTIETLGNYIKHIGERADDIRKLPADAQGPAWDLAMKEADDHFRRMIARDDARMEGLMRAGRNGGAPIAEDVMAPFRRLTKETREFYAQKQQTIKAFLRKKFQSPEQREAAWQKLWGHLDTEYAKMIEGQRVTQGALDSALLRYVNHVNPALAPHVQAWRGTVLELRMRYMADVKQAYRHIATIADPADKAKAYKQLSEVRLSYMDRLHRAEREGLEALENGRPFGSVRGMDPDTMAIYRSKLPERAQKEVQTLHDEVMKATGDVRLADQAAAIAGMKYSRASYSYIEEAMGKVPDLSTTSTQAASQHLLRLELGSKNQKLTPEMVEIAARNNIKDPTERLNWLQRAMDQFDEPHKRIEVQRIMRRAWEEMDDDARLKWLGESKGSWFSIEAKTPELTGDALDRANYQLRQDLIDMGYDPIDVVGVWDGEKTVSNLVLGGRETDAFYLGQKYNQQSFATNGGLVATTKKAAGDPGVGRMTRTRGLTPLSAEDPNGMYFKGKDGKDVGFRLDVDFEDWSGTWVAPVRPGAQGKVTLVRFGPENLKILHPDDAAARTGVSAAEARSIKAGLEPPRLNYYLENTPYEANVATPGRAMYKVQIAAEDLYDVVKDSQRIVAKFTKEWGARAARGEVPISTASPEFLGALQRELMGRGFLGMTNPASGLPNGVIIWRPLVPNNAGAISFVGENLNLPSIGRDYVVSQLRQQFGMEERMAEKMGDLLDARAKVWSLRTGKSKTEWYETRLRAIVSGEPGANAVGAKAALYERGRAPNLTAKQVIRKLNEYGTLDPDDAIEMLGGPQAPERIQGYVQYLAERRQRLLENGFEPRETVKAYLMTAGTAKTSRADARLVDRVLDQFDIVMDPSGGQQAAMLYRMREEAAWVSPEDFMGMILNTKDGRKLIDVLASGPGHVDEEWALAFLERIDNARQAAFGRRAVATLFPGKKKTAGLFEVKDICDALNKGAARGEAGEYLFNLDDVSRELQRLQGIGPVKHNFLAQYLGIGNKPTIDSREVGFWIGGGRKLTPDTMGASFRKADGTWVHGRPVLKGNRETLAKALEYYRSTKQRDVIEAVDRAIADSFAELKKRGIGADWEEEEWGAAMHRWIWEAVGEEATYGDASYMAMRLAQDTGKGVDHAAIVFDQEYKAVIGALNKPTAVSVVHELGHMFRGELDGKDLAVMEKYLGITDGKWTVEHQEWFAKAFVKWATEGVAPTRQLVPVFDQFKAWLKEVWTAVTKLDPNADVSINDEVRGVFNRLFDDGQHNYELLEPRPGIRATMFDRMVPEQPSIGGAADELNFRDGGNLMSKIRDSAQRRIFAPRTVEQAVPDEWQSVLKGYADYGVGKMRDAQAYANNYAKIKRDSALLNYRQRSYFDQTLGNFVPFGFWTTHSMRNWFLWGVDKPKFLADFMRLRNFAQRNGANKYAPSRLQGSWPIGKMPFLPEWMGPLFVDPLRTALPFDIWSEPLDQAVQYGQDVIAGAEGVLRSSLEKGLITQPDFDEAMKLHDGPTWEAALKAAKETTQGRDPLEGLGMLLQPHAPIVWALKAAQGKQDEIGPFLPATGQIKGLTALLGVPGGVNIEGWLRKKLGLPEFDKWEDYRVDRMLSNMAADGSANVDEVQAAMINRSGPVFEEAKRRAGIEYGVMKVTGSLGIPVKAWPEGEQMQKVLMDEMNAAYRAQDAGDKTAVSQFFDAHPEVKARLALFDTPQERLKTFLVDQVWSQWNTYSDLEKQAVKDALGDDFTSAFLNKDTRSYDSIDAPMLVSWLKLMGRDPGILSVPTGIAGATTATKVKFPPEAIVKASLSFYEIRDRYFPWEVIRPLSDKYFKLTEGSERANFIKANPLLKRYWDWRRQWIYQNPLVAPYIEEDPTKLPQYSQKELERLSQAPMNLSPDEWRVVLGPATFNLLLDYKRQGTALPEAAKARAERLAEKYGMTLEQIVGQLK